MMGRLAPPLARGKALAQAALQAGECHEAAGAPGGGTAQRGAVAALEHVVRVASKNKFIFYELRALEAMVVMLGEQGGAQELRAARVRTAGAPALPTLH